MNANDLFLRAYEVVVQPILLLMLGVAAVWYVMGLLRWISGAKVEERRAKGLRHQDQGLLGLIIMFSVFGLISMIANTLNVDDPTDDIERHIQDLKSQQSQN